MPAHLAIMDEINHLYTFAGKFGVIYDWCFSTRNDDVVIFSYSFPHGTDMRQFEMR
jgi:hypothetical protein